MARPINSKRAGSSVSWDSSSASKPVDGAGFAMVQGSGASEKRLDASSTKEGDFYLYLPAEESGEWTISMVGVYCSSSIVDTGCNFTGTFDPAYVEISVPAKEIVEFRYVKP